MKPLTLKLIKEKLPIGTCIHATRKGSKYKIVEYKDDKIFFSIPNYKFFGKYYKKSIAIELIIDIYKSKEFDFKELSYKDCRRSASKGIIEKLKLK